MSSEIAEKSDDQRESYEQFGKCLKLGVREDATSRTKIAELLDGTRRSPATSALA